jgi:hypothetical protein
MKSPGLEQRETRGTRPGHGLAGNNAPGETRESAIRYYIDRESSNVCRRFWGDIRKNLE